MFLNSSLQKSSLRLRAQILFIALLVVCASNVEAQRKRRASSLKRVGGARAVVIDERLAALRAEPHLNAPLLKRLGRGRAVAILGAQKSNADGVTFYRVFVTRRTGGWLPQESVAAFNRAGEDARLLRLIQASQGFDRIARAAIFLDNFARSPLRPAVLLLYADAAESAAARLTREAARRMKEDQIAATGASRRSYFLNYAGLDRFNRQGVAFTYDAATDQLHYDGARWRELIRRFPRSTEAAQARARLKSLMSGGAAVSQSADDEP